MDGRERSCVVQRNRHAAHCAIRSEPPDAATNRLSGGLTFRCAFAIALAFSQFGASESAAQNRLTQSASVANVQPVLSPTSAARVETFFVHGHGGQLLWEETPNSALKAFLPDVIPDRLRLEVGFLSSQGLKDDCMEWKKGTA